MTPFAFGEFKDGTWRTWVNPELEREARDEEAAGEDERGED